MDGDHLITEPLNESTGFYIRATRKVGEWQTRLQKLEIYDTPQYGRMLRLGGCNLTSERDEFVYHENLIHPALTAQPAPRRVLILGGSDGGSAEEALKHSSIEQVTMCEADEEAVRIAREQLAAVHGGVFDNPRLQVTARDGASVLREGGARYDLIVLDRLCGPVEAHDSVEFLGQCRMALAFGGALVLPLGAPMARPARVAEIAQRLNGMFRIVRPYTVHVPLFGSQWAMAVCSDKLDPKALTADEIDRRIESRRLQDLRFYNGETHEGVFALPNYLRDLVNPPRLKLQARGRRLGVVQAVAK